MPATKKKTVVPRSKAPVVPRAVQPVQERFAQLPQEAFKVLGWRQSCTEYYLDAKELSKAMHRHGFSQQTPMQYPGGPLVHEIIGFTIQEMGALNIDEPDRELTTHRIVKVTNN